MWNNLNVLIYDYELGVDVIPSTMCERCEVIWKFDLTKSRTQFIGPDNCLWEARIESGEVFISEWQQFSTIYVPLWDRARYTCSLSRILLTKHVLNRFQNSAGPVSIIFSDWGVVNFHLKQYQHPWIARHFIYRRQIKAKVVIWLIYVLGTFGLAVNNFLK